MERSFYQECPAKVQNNVTPYAEHALSLHPHVTPTLSSYCHGTAYQASVAQNSAAGIQWDTNCNQMMMQRQNCSPQVPVGAPPMYINAFTGLSYADPRGPMVACDPYVFGPQPIYQTNYPVQYSNPYRQPLQSPRHFVTITQLNYQPVGYQSPQMCPLNPPQGRRFDAQNPTHDHDEANKTLLEASLQTLYNKSIMIEEQMKNFDAKCDDSETFEYTIQPEQIVTSLCDDKEQDSFRKVPSENGTENTWADYDVMNPLRIEDDDLTKFIVDGCLNAESIAVKNQHRPCFKNIKHLCNRTRTDILKPRTTVANIHSQGIPWATKDFIFAFVRLVNCWYILKGYLEDQDGSLGKIDAAMSPEFKECYHKWQSCNKEMIKHLIDIFVSLDNGITIQNAEIYSSFNQGLSSCASEPEKVSPNVASSYQQTVVQVEKCTQYPSNTSLDKRQSEVSISKEPDNDLSSSSEGLVNVPGLLRVKNVFGKADKKSEKDVRNKIYMKPGSYRVPKKKCSSPQGIKDETDRKATGFVQPEAKCMMQMFSHWNNSNYEVPPTKDVWESALESVGPFMKGGLQDSENGLVTDSQSTKSSSNKSYKDTDNLDTVESNILEIQSWLSKQEFEMCDFEDDRTKMDKQSDEIAKPKVFGEKLNDNTIYSNICFWSKRKIGLSPLVINKFGKIIHSLWKLHFAKYVTFEVNTEHMPDYYKYISKPMFLYNIMNNLKQNKYNHAHEVVHDLRCIVRNSELYIQKRPDWWFENCLEAFSKELEEQLGEQFSSYDFSLVTGDTIEIPSYEYFEKSNASGLETDDCL